MKPTTPGAKKLITELLDRADRSEGKLPGKVLLSNYSKAEQLDVIAQLQRPHFTRAGPTIRVHLDKWASDRHAGSKSELLHALYEAAGRKPNNTAARERQERAELAAYIKEQGSSTDLQAMANDALSGRGWVSASLKSDGLATTKIRVENYLILTTALPLQDELPLRTYCSRRLSNSHVLDDDVRLRGAFERYVLATWPNHDEPEGSWMEAGLLIGSARGLAQAYGHLILEHDGARVDLAAMAQAGHGMALERKFIESAALITKPALATFIENPSTYTELRKKLPAGHLIALTDGFPSKATRALAQKLVKAGIPVRHWGDVDPEGFRILQQLGPGVKPHAWMGAGTVRAVDTLTTLGDKEKRFRRRLAQSGIDPEERAALEACLERKGWLEQEFLPVPERLE